MPAGGAEIVSRIRKLMPWEESSTCIEIEGTSLGVASRDRGARSEVVNFMEFDKVFTPKEDNNAVFDRLCKPLCDNILSTGYNSLLMAYGQTGSGKTFTMLGGGGIVGILPMSIDYLMKSDKVVKAEISAVEVYGVSTQKLSYFDLYDDANLTQQWAKKEGKRSMEDPTSQEITKDTDVVKTIERAQQASHYAPTGKNPHSSRGHTTFIITVTMVDGHEADFICMDLAGSEGITALGPEFQAKVGKEVVAVRSMEAGAINYGLQQLQALINEVGTKKGVEKTVGNGVRRLLHPFVQPKRSPMVSVLFTLSPSSTNLAPTRATLRVAQVIANIKITPRKVNHDKSPKQLIIELKKQVREQNWHIEKLEEEIAMLKGGRTSVEEMRASGAHERVEYNKTDLQRHMDDLEKAKADIKRQETMVLQENEGVPESELSSDVQAELDELRSEIVDLNEEVDSLQNKIKDMSELDHEMNDAIQKDRTNTVFGIRMSKLLEMSKFQQTLKETEMIDWQHRAADSESDGDYVRIKKDDLNALQKQLQSLAQTMAMKRDEAKKRNDDLAQFVNQIQGEQKMILSGLTEKMKEQSHNNKVNRRQTNHV